MIIMRGPQAVGKSSLCAALGLARNTISSDELRLAISAPELDSKGKWGISQEHSPEAWRLFDKILADRIDRGETVALDAMFMHGAEVKSLIEKGARARYDIVVADFTDFPFEQALARDAGREPMRRVGKATMERSRAAFARTPLAPEHLKGAKRELWTAADGDAGLIGRISKWLEVPIRDLSSYQKVMHVGDLQGCFDVLAGPGGPLEKGLDPNLFYVFCGDLVDRGQENGKVVAWFIDKVAGRPNAVLVWGNHEDHLWRYANGEPAVSKEFSLRTQPQLAAAGITPARAALALQGAVDIFPYVWNGRQVVVNHAGLTGLPPRDAKGVPQWHLISRQQLAKGAGSYSDPIDQAFGESQAGLEPALRWAQVHGHRNHGAPVLAHELSVNLEDGVEFGGKLRWAQLSASGWEGFERSNKVYATWRERFAGKGRKGNPQQKDAEGAQGTTQGEGMQDQGKDQSGAKDDIGFAFDVRAPIPSWITDEGSAKARLEPATLKLMRGHAGVMEKSMPDRPHISSLNFTRDVFFDKKWDDVVVKARGLFIDTETGEVAARGYDKFFNIGERKETELSSLATTLTFPVVGYLKENGFLGNLGYDAERDELMCASKSTTGGEFAGWFKEIFEASVPLQIREEIKRYLRDAEASMVFEVVDPARDPHMIEYDSAKIVLLDVFHRSEDGLKLPHDDLKKVGAAFGLEVKRRMFEFNSMAGLAGWISKAYKDMGYRYGGLDIEGVVFEDGAGFQTKCKMPHYGFWKSMRTTKDRIARSKEKISAIDEAIAASPSKAGSKAQERDVAQANLDRALESDSHPMAVAFSAWCMGREAADLSGSGIIDLRRQFSKEVGIDPAWMLVKWDRFDPTEKEDAPKKKEKGSKALPAEQAQAATEPASPKPKM